MINGSSRVNPMGLWINLREMHAMTMCRALCARRFPSVYVENGNAKFEHFDSTTFENADNIIAMREVFEWKKIFEIF